MKFIYLGHHVKDAYSNMATDSMMLKTTQETGETYLRFYDFENPSLVLAWREHPSDILQREDIDVTRRVTEGSVILCDNRTLSYSITSSKKHGDNTFSGPENAHSYFGGIVSGVFGKLGISTEVGKRYYLRVDGKPILGHGQYWTRNGILYHGIIPFEPWDIDLISRTIKLRDGEAEMIQKLPYMSQFGVSKQDFIQTFLETVEYENGSIPDDISNETAKFKDEGWIERAERDGIGISSLETNEGFCFIDLKNPE